MFFLFELMIIHVRTWNFVKMLHFFDCQLVLYLKTFSIMSLHVAGSRDCFSREVSFLSFVRILLFARHGCFHRSFQFFLRVWKSFVFLHSWSRKEIKTFFLVFEYCRVLVSRFYILVFFNFERFFQCWSMFLDMHDLNWGALELRGFLLLPRSSRITHVFWRFFFQNSEFCKFLSRMW